MDPLGFALENFDAIGKWRDARRAGAPVDASAALPDGTRFHGPAGLRGAARARRDQFVRTVTEKLLTYALGRGLEYLRPAHTAASWSTHAGDYTWSSIILGIVVEPAVSDAAGRP